MSRKSQLRPALSEDLFSSEEDTQLHSPPIGDIQADNQPDTQPDSQRNVLQESQQVMELDSQPLDIESIDIPVPSRQDSRSIAVEEQENTQYRGAQKKKKLTRVSFDDATEVELVEWYSNNRMFYDKSLKEYKDTEKKKRIMEEKASSLNNPVTGMNCIQHHLWLGSVQLYSIVQVHRLLYSARNTHGIMARCVEALKRRDILPHISLTIQPRKILRPTFERTEKNLLDWLFTSNW